MKGLCTQRRPFDPRNGSTYGPYRVLENKRTCKDKKLVAIVEALKVALLDKKNFNCYSWNILFYIVHVNQNSPSVRVAIRSPKVVQRKKFE